jgi:hypothetical protein
MAFLNKITDRQSESTELSRHRDDQAHVGGRDLVQSFLITLTFPAQGKSMLFIASKIRRLHRGSDQASLSRFFHRQALHCRNMFRIGITLFLKVTTEA